MADHIEGSRNSCALHGTLAVVESIEGAVPVIHGTAGCGVQNYLGVTRLNPGSDPFGAPPISSSNIGEKHVVFGGGSRLREQLKNTVKVVRGDLYAVLSGCATEMVGDDIPAMAKEGREQGWPVIFANTPGFRGAVHQGYQLAVKALIEQLPDLGLAPVGAAAAGAVNVWGIIPRQDPFWRGNLEELGRLLEGIGLAPNLLFAQGEGVAAWQRVPGAVLNLAVSSWGELPARLLAERYGTPLLSAEGLPVGRAAGELLRRLARLLSLDQGRVEAFIEQEERRLNAHLAGLADTYYRNGFQREYALVGESAQLAGLNDFLVGTLGLLPRLLIVTDNPPEQLREALAGRLAGQSPGRPPELAFSEDRAEIADLILAAAPELLLGSSLEAGVARQLGAPFLQVSFPAADRVLLSRGYAGYRGAATLLEDLGSAILAHAQAAAR